jgi:DNA-binding XRE family transcriptional regulator|nr:MAG TPA: helix-turn-helix domain protein [Caudoviricetes sp.]
MKDYDLQLTKVRRSHKMTQEELAAAIGVSTQVISNWERQVTNIPLDMAFKICQLFNCTLDELVGNETSDAAYKNARKIDALMESIKDVNAVIEELKRQI